MEALLSAKTSALCFSKDDFMVKDFSVDKFVSNCRKYVSLETMLEDLGVYHKILCSAMIELINKDYADFVNLSSNLVGLDKSIKILAVPLEKLKADIKAMKENLDETLNTANSEMLKYSSAYKAKVLAHHVLCVLEGLEKINSLSLSSEKIPSDILERMALDFNIVQFHMNKISCLKNIESKKVGRCVEEVAENLKQHLEQLFLQSLSTNDSHSLHKVLRIYALIDKEKELETFFAQTVVKPYMECHITEENILKLGLSKVYDNILNFITSSTAILEATGGAKMYPEVVPGYDFLVNAVWPEIVHCFELIAPVHVYAHGDPALFHTNYTSTLIFLDRFEHYCETQASVKRLRQHETYEKFLNKWNLDVYFQIRFQEIAGQFEESLQHGFVYIKDSQLENKVKENAYLLKASCTVSECVRHCWDTKVFLKPLGHNFFRLNLLLIARFYKAASVYFKSGKGKELVNPVEAAALIRDVEIFIAELRQLFDNKICLELPRNIIEAAYQQSIKFLQDNVAEANLIIIKCLTKQCCTHLKLMSDIPRLYRKTNREVPSKPSSYVSLVFNILTDFFVMEANLILPAKYKKSCLEQVTNNIFDQCINMVQDVLTAIKKMEDSLKILKRARDKGPTGSTGAMSDDEKIRRQLLIDINTVEEKARDLGIDIDSSASFKGLKQLMDSTEKSLSQRHS